MILVTGGAGFIGSNLVNELLKNKLPIAVCDFNTKIDKSYFKDKNTRAPPQFYGRRTCTGTTMHLLRSIPAITTLRLLYKLLEKTASVCLSTEAQN